ncbi:MAG: hypothetical protein IJJ63_02615 [Bacilli bacterium]|nr:hypothetical protein [Bacilli bacterium]
MSVSSLYVVNPYNDTHIQMLNEYEKRNKMSTNLSEQLRQMVFSIPEEEYLKNKKNRNEIEERLFLEKESMMIDSCLIQGEKDIKTGRISLSPKKGITKRRKIVSLAINYALNTLNLEEVFIMIDPTDKETITYLKQNGYECLGEEQGNILFLTEQEERIKNKRMIA